jgi:hypothetical protein
MRKFIILLYFLTSCRETAYLSRTGYVSEINQKRGYFIVFFPCENQRYKNQLCGAYLPYRLDSTVTLFQKYEVK